MTMLVTGETFELGGKTITISWLNEEDDLCIYSVEINGSLRHYLTPIVVIEAASTYASMQVGR